MAPSPHPSLLGATVEATITSLGGLGDGIAQTAGKPIFINKSCIGDVLSVRITHENHDGYTATIERVLHAGQTRREAPCPHFNACGGCTMQQLKESEYRAFKTRMCENAITRTGYSAETMQMVFAPPASRRRVEFKTHMHDGELHLAFYKPRSRNPVFIRTCLILLPELEALMQPLQRALQTITFRSDIRAVSLCSATSGIELMLHVANAPTKPKAELLALLETLNLDRASLRIGDGAAFIAAERAPLSMRFGATDMPLPPDAFLQATAQGEAALVDAVLEGIPAQGAVVDLFSGLGTYSFPLLQRQPVHAVEMEQSMVQALKNTAHPGFTAEQRDLFKDPLQPYELSRFAAAVINPPRVGAKAQTQAIAASAIRHVVMVSCNPASFTRDAQSLKQAGFQLRRAIGIDQFVWSPHLEIAAIFEK